MLLPFLAGTDASHLALRTAGPVRLELRSPSLPVAPIADDFWHPDDLLPAAIDDGDIGDVHLIEDGTGKIRRFRRAQMVARLVFDLIARGSPSYRIDQETFLHGVPAKLASTRINVSEGTRASGQTKVLRHARPCAET
jgi:hypothetical protein